MGYELTCKKLGMTRLFTEGGASVPVTVLEAEANVIVQKKTEAKDGYTALQVGSGTRRPKTASKALRGHYAKAGVELHRQLNECRISVEEAAQYEIGQSLNVSLFEPGQRVDVIGTSKGRGTKGVVARHHFSTPESTHGTHENFRHGGSIGPGAYPGHVIKGLKMPGRMGNERVTTRNVEVVKVDADQGLIFLRGTVPGHRNGIVQVRAATATRKG